MARNVAADCVNEMGGREEQAIRGGRVKDTNVKLERECIGNPGKP